MSQSKFHPPFLHFSVSYNANKLVLNYMNTNKHTHTTIDSHLETKRIYYREGGGRRYREGMAALASLSVAGGFVGPSIEVVKWISAPLRRQFSYLCCFRSNINSLQGEADNLEDVTRGLQIKVGAARNNAQLIFPQIETWLRNSDEKRNEINGILDEVPNVGSGCLKVGERYSLSKRAKKATIAIKELLEKCKFSDICGPPPTAASAPVESGTAACEFESRRQIRVEIMKSLGDNNVNKIGICGMGGLGKTTMAREIMNVALEKRLFEEVVMAVVSQPVDKLNIQLQIAEPLGLKFEDETLIPRANMLRGRLKGNKRSLVVLDDVWGDLNIEELGIPCEYGCRVILTSRNSSVLRAMNVEKVFQLKILDEKESWIMFRGKAGNCVVDVVLNPIAEDVMRECKGLPIALVNVGIALKDEKDLSIWEDALGQLRRSNPSDIPSMIEQVYNPLKLSYDRLGDENKNAKSLFLLCCLFPEDCDIPLKHLTYFATGLNLFQDIWELKEVRGRMSTLVKMLKTRGLLLDGSDEDHVRMHDVTRDVSIFIASEERRVKCSDCTWISSHVDGGARLVPLMQSCFPQLKLLFMTNMDEEQEMDSLIGGSTELNVLLIKYGPLKSLPLIISLTTLALYRCASLESIAAVGKMESLEILSCYNCYSIKELPEQVRGLKCLKLLEISGCYNLKRVAAGVISSMVGLEELKIVRSFKNWKGGEGGKDASLSEIESLKKLRCLEIEVCDVALAAQQPSHLSSKLVQFAVQFGETIYSYHKFPERTYERGTCLNFGGGNYIDWGVLSGNIFLTRTEYLYASGTYKQDFQLNLAAAPSIRWLALKYFENKKNIASAAAAFPLLEYLYLESMFKLEEIWDDASPIPSNSFTNLKHLKLDNLWALKRMGKSALSTANDFFLQLETIEIENCREMEHLLALVANEDDEENHIKTVLLFPKLKTLRLCHLPSFGSMISSIGIASVQFPLLDEMIIERCDSLKCLVSDDDDDDDDDLHLFCHPKKVSFGNLQRLRLVGMESKDVWCDHVPMGFFTGLVELYISHCSKIGRLFSSSSKISQNLVNLQKLEIFKCQELVKVIGDEEEVSVSSSSAAFDDDTTKHTTTHLFPSLQHLEMYKLPKLDSFCNWRCPLELSSLKILEIYDCHEMKSFNAAGSLITTPALQTARINGEDLKFWNDLNASLQHHFELGDR